MKHQRKVQDNEIYYNDLTQLKHVMGRWKQHKYESRPFVLFDFESWADAKIKGKLISQLYV